jgi:hypothetical protein
MKFDKTELRQICDALDDQDPQSDAAAAMASFLSALRKQMDDGEVAEIYAATTSGQPFKIG